jgi:hypothetical protein
MRTVEELIAELDDIALTVDKAAIVVGFETTTIFVWSDKADRLSHLTEAVKSGGMPIGYAGIRFTSEGEKSVEIMATPLRELSEQDWVKKLLMGICQNVANQINSLKG